MAQNDDSQTPNMAQDADDMSQDNRQSPPTTPPPPPLTPLPHTPPRFTVEEEQTRLYRRVNAQGTQLTVRLLPPPEGQDSNPMSHFLYGSTVSPMLGMGNGSMASAKRGWAMAPWLPLDGDGQWLHGFP